MLLSFFSRIKLRLQDMGTIKKLFLGAEQYARKNDEEAPGSEHFLLSAIDLPDGTVRKVFERIGVDSEQIEEAIQKQYKEALKQIGIDSSELDLDKDDGTVELPERIFYESKPSVQAMMKELVALRKTDKDIPLLGLHVIEVLASKKQGVVTRTLKLMGVSREALKQAVVKELDIYKASVR